MKMTEETLKTIRNIFDKITFCQECEYCEKTTNRSSGYFCDQFGGEINQGDFCSRGVEK